MSTSVMLKITSQPSVPISSKWLVLTLYLVCLALITVAARHGSCAFVRLLVAGAQLWPQEFAELINR